MDRRLFVRPAAVTGLVLLVPLVMTRLDRGKPEGDGWRWSAADFLIMGTLLLSAGLGYEGLARRLRSKVHRAGLALVTLGIVLALWAELAVGAVSQVLGGLLG